jgi:putative transposase
LAEIAAQLGFVPKLRSHTPEGGIVERPFKTLNQKFISELPGYTASNVEERPKDAEKDAQLTLRELEQLLVRFIVHRYNRSIDARMGDQSRYQRWEAGLRGEPELMSERDLDICLMKVARRTVQRGGHLQFENVMYRGEYLEGYAGETVTVRYDPRDITTIWIYRQEKQQEVFLTRAHAQGLETEQLPVDEAKASAKRLREAGKTISNQSILLEVMEREAFVEGKKTRKQRQKEEQSYKQVQANPVAEAVEPVESEPKEATQTESEFAEIEVWDLDELREDYGW